MSLSTKHVAGELEHLAGELEALALALRQGPELPPPRLAWSMCEALTLGRRVDRMVSKLGVVLEPTANGKRPA